MRFNNSTFTIGTGGSGPVIERRGEIVESGETMANRRDQESELPHDRIWPSSAFTILKDFCSSAFPTCIPLEDK